MAGLPRENQRVTDLRLLGKKSFDEIADETGLPRTIVVDIMAESIRLINQGLVGNNEPKRDTNTPQDLPPQEQKEPINTKPKPKKARNLDRDIHDSPPQAQEKQVNSTPNPEDGHYESGYRNHPDFQPGSNGELSPFLQDFVDAASKALMKGRSEFMTQFPKAFFPDETMTDAERRIFSGRRALQNQDDFPKLCAMWGLTLEEGERLWEAALQKYYEFAND